MPASSPPALLLRPRETERRRVGLGADRSWIGSWTCEPGRRAASKPMPISTPFIACTAITGLGQPAVELLVPLGVRAESEGHALDADLDDAAQRVAGPLAAWSINAVISSS